MKEYLLETARVCGIELSKEHLDKFEKFYFLLTDRNRVVNLTSITEPKDVALKHFIDSLSAEPLIPKGAMLADVGSGGGFPGIPLKIFRPDIKAVLIDSLNKRVSFLNEAISALDLKEAEVQQVRAEDAGRGVFREHFDVVVSRAVARLNLLSEYCLPLVKIGGNFIAYKTKDGQELDEAKRAINILGGEVEQVRDFNLKEFERRLIVIKKTGPVSMQYPRDAGKIKKSPL